MEPDTDSQADVEDAAASTRPRVRGAICALGVAGCAAGVAIAAYSPWGTLGWYLLIGGLVTIAWTGSGFIPRRYRPVAGVVAFLGGVAAVAWWTPTKGSGSWFQLVGPVLGLACLALPALVVAVVVSRFSTRFGQTRPFLGLTATLVFVMLGLLVADDGSLRLRLVLRQDDFTATAQELLSGPDGSFAGTTQPELVSSDPTLLEADLPLVDSVAGMQVLYGEVLQEPRQVRLCLSSDWTCTRTLIYSPDESLDGQRGLWNTDCDMVARRLAGDWYLQAVECPRN